MNTANKLTLSRVAMIPAFMAVLIHWNRWVALGIFIVASLTDLVDGHVARKYNQTSDFGKFLDPLADKLLVLSAMLIFVQWDRMPAWSVMVVLTREFAVSGLRMVGASKGVVLAAAWSGKVKTAATMVGLCVMIAFPLPLLDGIITGVIVATTLYSGFEYFIKNWQFLVRGGF